MDTTVAQVAWVLISFNLVLGLVAVPSELAFTRPQPRIFTPSASPQRSSATLS